MKRSDLAIAFRDTFGPALGETLYRDLVLPPFGRTAVVALDEGRDPQQVWDAVCVEMNVPASARFPHRRGPAR